MATSRQEQLLQRPPETVAERFFCDLFATGVGAGLAVRHTSDMGRGVFADVDFKEGDVVLQEPPLVAMQHSHNRARALVCSHCLRFIGPLELAAARLLMWQKGMREEEDKGESDEGKEAEEENREEADAAAAKAEGVIQQLSSGQLKLPFAECAGVLPSAVACPGGCTQEVFCSSTCATSAWAEGHAMLCLGHASHAKDTQALKAFYTHADESNDIFRLAAKVVASALSRAHTLLGKGGGEVGEEETEGKGEAEEEERWKLVLEAWMPFAVGHKAIWWEAVACPPDVVAGSDEEASFRACMKSMAEESLNLLAQAIGPLPLDLQPLLSLSVYGATIGMFELNNLDLVVPSPVTTYFNRILDLDDAKQAEAEGVIGPLRALLEQGGGGRGQEGGGSARGEGVKDGGENGEEGDEEKDTDGNDGDVGIGDEEEKDDDDDEEEEDCDEDDEDDKDDDLLQWHCQGTAFYSLQSSINHSCCPNAHAFKRDEDVDGRAVLLASRDIKKGEQIFIAYVEESLPLQERREALADYGFVCRCELCEAQGRH
ncbi:hypothetical protein CLOM_g20809 [Closterium sp. NIES-68]|nr:hypothetical protein CLOM_g20809 [Closterium sp. NIES-68]